MLICFLSYWPTSGDIALSIEFIRESENVTLLSLVKPSRFHDHVNFPILARQVALNTKNSIYSSTARVDLEIGGLHSCSSDVPAK